jgi:hypothetical protein
MRAFELKIGAVLLVVALVGTTGHAQTTSEGSSVAPLQPVVQPVDGINATNSGAHFEQRDWNESVLTGAQQISPEAQSSRRSYWQPFFNVTSTVDTNPLAVANSVSLVPWASFYGGFDLYALSRRSDLSLSYLGGGVVSQYRSEDAPIQQLKFAGRLNWRRAAISFIDQFGFFPEAVLASYLPTGVSDLSGNNQLLLQQAFLPNQSIASAVGQELTNTSVGELDVSVGPQSSFSLLGSYSAVRYFNNNLLDLDDIVLQAGFNRQLSRNNTVALLYRFVAFRFNSVYQPMNGHVVQAAFGRRVSHRWAFELAAGPELAQFRPVSGETALGTFASTATEPQRVFPTADLSATYRSGHTLSRFGYVRGVTDGGGFLAGAVTDAGYGTLEHQLSRGIIGELTGGYAKNRGLIALTQQPGNQIYRDWFGRATVSHAWGRWASVFLGYQVQRQAKNSACVGLVCANDFTRQLLSIGLTTRAQPRLIG